MVIAPAVLPAFRSRAVVAATRPLKKSELSVLLAHALNANLSTALVLAYVRAVRAGRMFAATDHVGPAHSEINVGLLGFVVPRQAPSALLRFPLVVDARWVGSTAVLVTPVAPLRNHTSVLAGAILRPTMPPKHVDG